MTKEVKIDIRKADDVGITFVSNVAGGIELYIATEFGEIYRRADTAEATASWITEHGIADNCYFSSSMDFGTEYGFQTNDGGRKMFETGVAIAISQSLEVV